MVDPNELASDLPEEIVEGVRAAREAHARAFGFDVARIVADLRAKDAASDTGTVQTSSFTFPTGAGWTPLPSVPA